MIKNKKVELKVLNDTDDVNIKTESNLKLTFGKANAKLKGLEKKLNKKVVTMSLPSGFTCPSALECLSKAERTTGKITDGKDMKFRCYAASLEAVFPSLRKAVWNNFDALKNAKTTDNMVKLIQSSLPKKFDVVRWHPSGDIFNGNYFDALIKIAENNPTKLFYAYTKQINLWVERLGKIPSNLALTASYGGKHDDLINKHNLKHVKVVFSVAEANGFPIDHDDFHAVVGKDSFRLILHGVQKSGSKAAEALKALDGVGSYGKNAKI